MHTSCQLQINANYIVFVCLCVIAYYMPHIYIYMILVRTCVGVAWSVAIGGTSEESKQLAHENVGEGFLKCMGRDAHVSTCCTAHRRMAHGGQESPQQRTTSCHILSYHVYSCPFMSHVLEPSFAHIHLAIIWHWTSLSSFADVGPCYSSVMREILSVQRVQDPSCLAEPTPAVVCLEIAVWFSGPKHHAFCNLIFHAWSFQCVGRNISRYLWLASQLACVCVVLCVCVCVRVSARARDKDFSCWRQCNNRRCASAASTIPRLKTLTSTEAHRPFLF